MNRIRRSSINEQDAAVVPVAVAPVAPRRTINPIFPVLCLGLVLCLIASTIVLALIPIYLQTRNIGRTNLLSARFSADIALGNGFLRTGTLSSENCARIQTRLRQLAAARGVIGSSLPSVSNCRVVGNRTSSGRRKRQAQTVGNVIRIDIIVLPGNCFSNRCVLTRAQALIEFILNLGDFILNLIRDDGTSFDFTAAFILASEVTLEPAPSTSETTSSASVTTTTTTTTSATPFDFIVFGLSSTGVLFQIGPFNLSDISEIGRITNLAEGEIITNIDIRPATGELYGTSNRRLYVIDLNTVAARPVLLPLDSSVRGNIISMEFDPVYDILRVVTDAGEKTSINPERGNIYYSPTRPNTTDTATSVAYSNSLTGATTTTLFSIDANTDSLSQLNYQLSTTPAQVGSGFGVNITATNGLDISATGVALACVQVDGNNGSNVLYRVDLTTGTLSQRIVTLDPSIISLAVQLSSLGYSIASNNNSLGYINFINQQFVYTYKTITGLQDNETIVAIDLRLSIGQLVGISSASRLYIFDMGTAEVNSPGNGSPFTPSLRGTSFSADFNPVVDRLRVVSNQGQNLVLNPDTGAVQSVDRDINPSNTSISCIAYSNNVANATNTTLYDISTSPSQVFIQAPPASGTLNLLASLNLTIQTCNGFDISSLRGIFYGMFTVNGVTDIYRIDSNTGATDKRFSKGGTPDIISFTVVYFL